MARPKKDIDPDQVRQLAAIQCSYDEMAAVLSCDPKTLTNRFSQVIKEGRSVGFTSLKRKQYEVAMKGNVGMLIWLGKQYLGQVDSPQKLEIKNEELQEMSDEQLIKMAREAIIKIEATPLKEIEDGKTKQRSKNP